MTLSRINKDCYYSNGKLLSKQYGVRVPSVSEIVSFYTGSNYQFINKSVLQASSDLGNEVHECCFSNKKPSNWKVKRLVNEYQTIVRINNITIRQTELSVSFSDLVQGRLDIFGNMGKTNILIDVKTGSVRNDDQWRLQLNLYRQCCDDLGIKRLFVIWLRSDRLSQIIEYPLMDELEVMTMLSDFAEIYYGGELVG